MRWGLKILRWNLFLFLSPLVFSQSPGNEINYREIFGRDYDFAVNKIETTAWWSDTLEKESIDPHFALSIVFPELIRYSSISDFIEVRALEVLYVQYGHEYANFSVGLFQLKPTFAEHLEADMLQFHLADSFPSLASLHPDTTDDVKTRKERIIRLKDEISQLKYLKAFILIMDKLYPEISAGPAEDKLTFYATAYNTGYWKGDKVIRCEGGKAYFHRGIVEPEVKYSYSGIALDYYLRKISK